MDPQNQSRTVRRNRQRKVKIRFVAARAAVGQKAWMVDGYWAEPGQAPARHRPFFESEAKAKDHKLKVELQLRAGGVSAPVLGPDERIIYQRAAAKLKPYGKTVLEAVDHYVRHLQTLANSCKLPALLDELIARRTGNNSSDTHVRRIRSICGRFVQAIGDRHAAEVNAAEVDAWIAGQKVGNVTKNNMRRYLVLLFGFAVRRGYCEQNVAEKVDRRKETPGETRILTPEQLTAILNKADPQILPYLTLRAFAGLRETEVLKTDWRDIRLDRLLIELNAGKTKTAQRRLVPIAPNLAAWLRPFAKPFGPVVTVNRWTAIRLFKRARTAAGIEGDGANELRHCYGSCRLAQTKNRNQVALEMGNSPAVVTRHYEALVDDETAARFWGILPSETCKPNVIQFAAV